MKRREFPSLAVCVCLVSFGCGREEFRDETPKAADGSPEAMAKLAVREFVTALHAGDQAGVLRRIDVPYYNDHLFEVIEDREELGRRYEEVLGSWTRSGPLPGSITSIRRYRETRGSMPEVARKKLDRVLTEDDFIVMLGDGPDEERYIFVRIKDDVAKVVGVTTR